MGVFWLIHKGRLTLSLCATKGLIIGDPKLSIKNLDSSSFSVHEPIWMDQHLRQKKKKKKVKGITFPKCPST